jgi:NADH-quinone oxidoreductase subunit G
MPKCTIDGKEIEVADGTTVIQAAEELGIRIPRFCWHPDLPVDGNCRMCLVEIEKMPKLQIACNTQVRDGMVVYTNSEKAAEAHRTTLEFLLINHPIDCPVCDQAGECYLQDQYMGHGLYDSKVELEDKVHKRKVVDLGPGPQEEGRRPGTDHARRRALRLVLAMHPLRERGHRHELVRVREPRRPHPDHDVRGPPHHPRVRRQPR